MMIFSANMVGRLVIDGQLQWWGRRSKEKKVFLDEWCDALVSLSTVAAATLAAILDKMEGGALDPAGEDYDDDENDVKRGASSLWPRPIASVDVLDVRLMCGSDFP